MSAARATWDRWTPEVRLGVIAGLVAIAWAVLVLDPLAAATIDPDASSSVLYFDRILSGSRLEAFVPTTPKPLLTVIFGLTWALLHDWRALTWETILAWGVAVGATAAFAARLGRGAVTSPRTSAEAVGAAATVGAAAASRAAAVAAVAFSAAALLASSDLLLEVSRANGLVWALAGWSVAGLAVTARPARPWLAGVALLVAGLCRFETLALTAVAVAVVLVMSWRGGRGVGAGARPASGTAGITTSVAGALLAAAALPVAMLHDWLLTGDPLYWLSVPTRYTEVFNPGLAVIDPLTYAGTLLGRLAPEWPLLVLAVLGVSCLLRARLWVPLAGIVGLGFGVVALLFRLAIGGIYISNRYYEPIDLALIVAAAVGAAWVGGQVAGRLGDSGRRRASLPVAVGLLAGVAGILATWPPLPWDRRATTELTDVRRASAHVAALLPDLQRLLAPTLVDRDPDRATKLLVPSRDVARVSIETAQPLDRILNSYAVLLTQGVDGLRTGQVVFHDGAADRPVVLYRPLEIDDQGPVGGNILVRLDPRIPEIWLLSVR